MDVIDHLLEGAEFPLPQKFRDRAHPRKCPSQHLVFAPARFGFKGLYHILFHLRANATNLAQF